MMFRTCTIQANLDFSDEADMVTKMRVGLALQPVATALFANSPFTEGKPNGFESYRSEIWLDTDRDRTGMLNFAFEEGFGFDRYVDWALDVPMYFVKRGDHYHDVAGASFRDLMDGRLAQLPGERATLSDWKNHLSTLFPEVRLKNYLEMRGADGSAALRGAGAVVGLLYNSEALDAAWQLVRDWTPRRETLRTSVRSRRWRPALRNRTVRGSLPGDRPCPQGPTRNLNSEGMDETIFCPRSTDHRYRQDACRPSLNGTARLERQHRPIFETHAY